MKYATLHTVVFLLLLLLGSGVAGARKKKTPVEQISAEQAFMEKNFSQIPCREWATGRTFIYLDSTLSPLLQPQYPLLPDSSLRGKLFVFCGFTDASMWGGGTMDIVFECEGTRYYYKTGKTLDDIKNTAYTPLLPMLIAQDEVELARNLLVGRTLYARPAVWVDSLGNTCDGGRYCAVTVKDVEPGNGIYPMAFVIEDDEAKTYRVYGSLTQTSRLQAATFDRLFTFDNPRARYADISDKHWRLITHGEVAAGMTKDECRLSLGRPQRVREIPTYSGLNEEWYYNTGAYLFFEDGKLVRFR